MPIDEDDEIEKPIIFSVDEDIIHLVTKTNKDGINYSVDKKLSQCSIIQEIQSGLLQKMNNSFDDISGSPHKDTIILFENV
jgi:hypothetical protein